MAPSETVLQRAARLRQRAEARVVATKYQNLIVLSPQEAGRLVHELRVHQIELEMQNEEMVRDAEGRSVRIHGIVQDITEQASSSRAVRRRKRPARS